MTETELTEVMNRNPGLKIKNNPLASNAAKTSLPRVSGKAEASHHVASTPAKKSKYRNVKTVRFGIVFDSQKECVRYAELRVLEHNGSIAELTRQVEYRMEIHGVLICKYVADFRYKERPTPDRGVYEWPVVVEDVKSAMTRKLPVYRIKKKLMLAIHGITIRET